MQELQCDYLQGYLYAKPLAANELTGFIQKTVEPGVAFG